MGSVRQVDPPLGADRDVEAFRNYMGPTQSLTWLADVLQSKRVSEGGGPWADEQDEKTRQAARKKPLVKDRHSDDRANASLLAQWKREC